MQLSASHIVARARSARRRALSAEGFTTVALMGALLITTLLTVAAFAAVDNDQPLGRRDQDTKTAYTTAEAGLADYLFHLNQDNAYWAKCTNVASPNAVNQAWNGTGADTRARKRFVPGTSSWYTLELIPANGASQCDPNNAQATMIDTSSGTFRIRSTGFVGTGSRQRRRSIVATFKRKNFLDYLYFTDYETADPTWYRLDTYGRQTNPDLVAWGSANCAKYWRQGRGNQSYNGQIFWFDNTWHSWTDNCTEIQFAPGDKINGPFHTNDEILVCGSPDFGRNAQDRVEVSGPGWRGNSGCSGNSPTFVGTWTPNAPLLTLPPSDTSLRQVAGRIFTGKTDITLSGTNMIVTNAFMGLNNVTYPLPANGVVYVQNASASTTPAGGCGQGYDPLNPYGSPSGCGDVNVSGSYGQDLTIGSEKDIIIDGNITKSGDRMLGLIANNFVRVYHPVTYNDPQNPFNCTNQAGTMTNVQIDAAILSLQHSFTVDNYYCGAALGTLTVNGTIAQKFRGPVGRGGSSIVNGYTKNYNYDDRLRFRSPPHFLDPVQSAWRIARYTEQLPPR